MSDPKTCDDCGTELERIPGSLELACPVCDEETFLEAEEDTE